VSFHQLGQALGLIVQQTKNFVGPGVGNLRLFSPSEVALFGFEKTWNVNLHSIMITDRKKLITV